MSQNDKYGSRSLLWLSYRQKDTMDLIAKNICRLNDLHKNGERITTSTFVRCLIDDFIEKSFEFSCKDIKNEEELLERIQNLGEV